jgi:hypothetical protein
MVTVFLRKEGGDALRAYVRQEKRQRLRIWTEMTDQDTLYKEQSGLRTGMGRRCGGSSHNPLTPPTRVLAQLLPLLRRRIGLGVILVMPGAKARDASKGEA